ncbi:MAG TPA: tripartite tricarboxylate transporter substrate-binding protein [Candidatus Limnocylindrales bacterium]|nr:tripartite tricarboxylate transporter substrate-binding protein [Candidatus Limnocylindrales bacterium]
MVKVFTALLISFITVSKLSAQTPFYQGKTVQVRVGFAAGGAFDVWARVIANHLGRFVPGNPTFVVQNMTGGGSMIAANYIYGVAKPDGLTLGVVSPAMYIEQATGKKEVQYDWSKFSFIGSPEKTDRIFYMRADTGIKTLEDMRTVADTPRCGSTGIGSAAYYFPRLLQDSFGLKLTIVPGYPGASDVNLAIEKGEVHCFSGTLQAYFGSEPLRTWSKTGFARVLVQGGNKRDGRMANVPTLWELMDKNKTSEIYRRLARILLIPDEMGRPLFGPPGMPPDRLKILRDGFTKMMMDPELLADARKKGLDAMPMSGEELDALIKEVGLPSADVVQRLKPLMEN